jgi:dCMP deaminase
MSLKRKPNSEDDILVKKKFFLNLEKKSLLSQIGFKITEFEENPGDAINHEDYIMRLACLTAMRSPDPSTKVGACIINEDRRIVGLGFNDFPHRYINQNFNEEYDFKKLEEKSKMGKSDKLFNKNSYLCHAAESAILNKNTKNLINCSMFTNVLPCNECFKLIVQSGIKKVFYLDEKNDGDWRESTQGSKVMSLLCDVELIKYEKSNLTPIEFISRGKALEFDQSNTSMLQLSCDKNKYYPDSMKDNLLVSSDLTTVLSEKDYFMFAAQLTSMRSKDPKKQVGACIVDEKGKIISIGYNGFPNNHKNIFPWDKPKNKTVNSKHMYVCHAELNAIVNKFDADINGCTLFQTLYPCINCARLIVQSGIKEIFYYEFDGDKKKNVEFRASEELFNIYGILCKSLKPSQNEADISSVFQK